MTDSTGVHTCFTLPSISLMGPGIKEQPPRRDSKERETFKYLGSMLAEDG